MAFFIGRDRKARWSYGFDDVALVPGMLTLNPKEIDISWKVRDLKFSMPIIASAMDGVVDVKFAVEMGRLGGLAVLNLEGVQTRYKNPDEIIKKIVEAKPAESTKIIQGIYKEPIKEELISERIAAIKKAGINRFTASDAFMAELRTKLAFMDTEWLKNAAGRGVDGKAAMAFYRSQAKNLAR